MESEPKPDLRDYLAAERTLLAWVRTGLALMGFGFVVARFGLFLQEFQAIQHTSLKQRPGLSLWFGTALIAAGVVVNVLAAWHHGRLIRALDRGDRAHSRSAMRSVAIALFLALVGLAMAIYLISVRSPAQSFFTQSKQKFMVTALGDGIIRRPHRNVFETVPVSLKLAAVADIDSAPRSRAGSAWFAMTMTHVGARSPMPRCL